MRKLEEDGYGYSEGTSISYKKYERYAELENNVSKKYAGLGSSNLSNYCKGSYEAYKLVINNLRELVSQTEEGE